MRETLSVGESPSNVPLLADYETTEITERSVYKMQCRIMYRSNYIAESRQRYEVFHFMSSQV